MTTKQYIVSLRDTSHATVQSLRIFNIRSMMLFYLIGQSLSNQPFSLTTLGIVAGLFFFLYSFASLFNFAEDSSIDKLNQRFTPISRSLSSSQLRFLGILFLFLAFSVTAYLHTRVWWGVFILFTISTLLYSSPWGHASHRPFPKLMLMALIYTTVPMVAGFGTYLPQISLAQWSISVALIIFYASWLMYSDIKDIAGDKAYGKITIAVRYGVPTTVRMAAVLGGIGFLGVVAANPHFNIPVLLIGALWCLQLLISFQPKLIYRPLLRRVGGYLLLGSLLCIWLLLATGRYAVTSAMN